MDTQKLLEYLRIVVELERDKYTQQRTLNRLRQQIQINENQATKNRTLVRGAEYINERSVIDTKNITVDQSGKGLAMFGVYYFGVLGAIIPAKLAKSVMGEVTPLVIIFGVIGAIVGGSIPWVRWKNKLKDRRRVEIEKIKKLEEADKRDVVFKTQQADELQRQIPKLKKGYEIIKNVYDTTCKTLREIYDIGIIPPKYREMIPVCMFYDYISNGRTYFLERQDADPGAINMYEEELFKRIIIGKFDEAIHQLERLRVEQRICYDRMVEAQNKSNELLTSIGVEVKGFRADVNNKMDTLIYKTDQNLKCNQYMAFVAYQDYMKS